jgi:D-alanyl-D-alanine dipeptidase
MLLAPFKQKNGEFYQGNGVEVDIHSKSMATEVDFGGHVDEFLALSITMLVEIVIDS